MTGNHCLNVNFFEKGSAILDALQRHPLKSVDERFGIDASVRLDQREDYIEALSLEFVRLFKHAVSLSHACSRADVHAQARLARVFYLREKRFSRSSADDFLHTSIWRPSVYVHQVPGSAPAR